MKKLLLAVLAGLFAAQPAVAATVLGDYDVYANGNAYIAGGINGDIASGSFTNADGAAGKNYTSQTASSAELTQQAHKLSQDYAALAPTGTVASRPYEPYNLVLTGTQSGINVFNIDGSVFSKLYLLTFTGLGSGAIVNVSGPSVFGNTRIDYGALSDPTQVLFNFFDASNVRLEGMKVQGSVLAPNALVDLHSETIAGSVISDRFHNEGTRIGGAAFTGFLGDPAGGVPEPATWAMLILGFGVIGGAMRRHTAAPFLSVLAAA